MKKEVVIIGGGIAGLTAGIQLSQNGISVMIIEKNDYPKHKVCGEYVSNEVASYLKSLAIPIQDAKPSTIDSFEFSNLFGKSVVQKLPLGGFGISRYTLDLILYNKAIANGCEIIKDQVVNCEYTDDLFTITTSQNNSVTAKVVLGAFGKNANFEHPSKEKKTQTKAPWLAVKNHHVGFFPDNLVGLYHFKGGYCGISKIEHERINICYITKYKSFQRFKNIQKFQEEVLFKNKKLKAVFENTTPIFDKPLTISQFSFNHQKSVSNHILMIGDAAGLIHPLCGNGMAMAIHSAKMASDLSTDFLNKKHNTRADFEKQYANQWQLNFKKRLQFGKGLSTVLEKPILTLLIFQLLQLFPFLLQKIIKQTHGKPIH